MTVFKHMYHSSAKPLHFTERNAYLCTRHQNFKSVGVKISVHPDIVVKPVPESFESFSESNFPKSIAYSVWKKIDILVKKGREEVPVKKITITSNDVTKK